MITRTDPPEFDGHWVLLTVTRGGTVSKAGPFNTRDAAEEAMCMAVTGMSRQQKKEADEAQRKTAEAWQRANPNGGCYTRWQHCSDGDIEHAFVFADPPASAEKMP